MKPCCAPHFSPQLFTGCRVQAELPIFSGKIKGDLRTVGAIWVRNDAGLIIPTQVVFTLKLECSTMLGTVQAVGCWPVLPSRSLTREEKMLQKMGQFIYWSNNSSFKESKVEMEEKDGDGHQRINEFMGRRGDSKGKKCQRNTCNILPVRILFTVFMFWKNLQTMNSVIPLGSGIQVYVWKFRTCIHLFTFGGCTFIIWEPRGKESEYS